MSAIAKSNPPSLLELGTQLFDQLGTLFSLPKAPSAKSVAVEVKKSVQKLQEQGSPAELRTLRIVFQEIATQMGELAAPGEDGVPSAEEQARADHEDEVARKAFEAMNRPGRRQTVTAKSIREGNEAMERAVAAAAEAVKERIEKGELITSAALQSALKVNRQAISGAVKADRLFSIVGPSGKNYYPAFYADPKLDRRAIEKVSKALGSLPGSSKYYFFTQKFTSLQATPLEALRKGKLEQVLVTAAGFVER